MDFGPLLGPYFGLIFFVPWLLGDKKLYTWNARLRYTHIKCCTLWEECKQAQCPRRSWRERTKALIWYYSPTKKQVNISSSSEYIWYLAFWSIWKIQEQYIFIPLLGPFSLKNDALPLNSLFWSPPTAVHRFDTWDGWFLVYIFLALYYFTVMWCRQFLLKSIS